MDLIIIPLEKVGNMNSFLHSAGLQSFSDSHPPNLTLFWVSLEAYGSHKKKPGLLDSQVL